MGEWRESRPLYLGLGVTFILTSDNKLTVAKYVDGNYIPREDISPVNYLNRKPEYRNLDMYHAIEQYNKNPNNFFTQ